MTETPTPTETRRRMVPVSLPDLLHALRTYTAPANQHLDNILQERVRGGEAAEQALVAVSHVDTMTEWCRDNPHAAACIVLCAVYLANGRHVAQEETRQPLPEVIDEPAAGTGEGIQLGAEIPHPEAVPVPAGDGDSD
jgi:hypothetical protein